MNDWHILQPLIDAGGALFEVGGPVRDRFLNQATKDHDYLVTGLPISTVAKLLEPFGKVMWVGKSFGVLKFSPFRLKNQTWDIAIPRKEISTGVGHRDFSVTYDHNLPVEEDLKRRDFTINAMAFDPVNQKLIDPFHGKEDLANHQLRQVFPEAFLEDPLRILRGVQFASRFNLSIEDETMAAMKRHAKLIQSISPERIIEEIKKLFMAEKPSRGILLMDEIGILHSIFPEVAEIKGVPQDKLKNDDVLNHTLRVLDASRRDPAIDYAGDLELMLAALYHDVGKKQTRKFSAEHNRVVFFGHQIVSKRKVIKRLGQMRASIIGVNISNVATLVEYHMFETKSFYSDKAIRRFINKVSPELIYKLVDLRIADNRGGKHPNSVNGILRLKTKITHILSQKPPFGAKDLAITGFDLMNLGVPEGPQIGLIIRHLVELLLDQPELNTKEQLIAICSEWLKTGLPELPKEDSDETENSSA